MTDDRQPTYKWLREKVAWFRAREKREQAPHYTPHTDSLDDAILWFVAYQEAREVFDMGTKDMAHMLLGGIPATTKETVEGWLENMWVMWLEDEECDPGVYTPPKDQLLSDLAEHFGFYDEV